MTCGTLLLADVCNLLPSMGIYIVVVRQLLSINVSEKRRNVSGSLSRCSLNNETIRCLLFHHAMFIFIGLLDLLLVMLALWCRSFLHLKPELHLPLGICLQECVLCLIFPLALLNRSVTSFYQPIQRMAAFRGGTFKIVRWV